MLAVVEAMWVPLIRAVRQEKPVVGRRRIAEAELDETAVERITGPCLAAERGKLRLECAELDRGGWKPSLFESSAGRSEGASTARTEKHQNEKKDGATAHA
jgi:hypothetical protein